MPTEALTPAVMSASEQAKLTTAIRVVHQALAATAGASAQQRALQGQQRQPHGVKAARDSPSHDAPGVDVGDERDVAEPAQDPDVGDVSDPQLVRPLGGEATFHEIRAGVCLSCRAGRDRLAATADSLQAGGTHETGDLVPADLPPGAGHRMVHLADAVDAVVLHVNPAEFLEQQDVSQGPRGGRSCLRGAVAHVEVMNPHSVARRVRQMASTPN
ncbi:hypothetical protein GCM10022241_22430 [Micrococcus endophyticus]